MRILNKQQKMEKNKDASQILKEIDFIQKKIKQTEEQNPTLYITIDGYRYSIKDYIKWLGIDIQRSENKIINNQIELSEGDFDLISDGEWVLEISFPYLKILIPFDKFIFNHENDNNVCIWKNEILIINNQNPTFIDKFGDIAVKYDLFNDEY